MKKIIYVLFLSILITSCFGEKGEVKEKENSSNIEKSKTVSYEGIEIDVSDNKVNEDRADIDEKNLYLLYAGFDTGEVNELFDISKKFISNLDSKNKEKISENVNGGIKYFDFESEVQKIPNEIKRNLNLDLTITDKSDNSYVSKGTVFVNSVNMGTFENGKFKKNFKWPAGTEIFNIVVRSDNYGDAFLTLNSLNLDGSLLLGRIKMKKAIVVKDFDLSEKTKVSVPKFKANFKKCGLVDKSGNCVEEKVDVKINFVSGNSANSGDTSLNMRALTKEGDITYLESGGMAFVDFIKKDGEILSLADGETMEIVYNVSNEDIKNMTIDGPRNEKNGYWWYDKSRGLWIETDAPSGYDIKSKTWKATVKQIY